MPKGYKKSWGKCVDNSMPRFYPDFPRNPYINQHYNYIHLFHFSPQKIGLLGSGIGFRGVVL